MKWKILFAPIISLLCIGAASAQEPYPSRPIKMMVGLGAGSSTDVTGRIVGQKMGQILGAPVVIENHGGAAGNIATGIVAHSPPDGYTLLFGSVATTVNVTLSPNTNFDLVKDLVPVALLATVPNILVVHSSLGVNSVDELIALARRRPGEILVGNSGIGTSPHLSAELFDLMAHVKMTSIPYQGSSQAMTDLLAGRTMVMFAPAPTALSQRMSGTLRFLASTQLKRAGAMPDLPTIDELGLKGFDTGVWFGLYVPTGTPKPVIDKLSRAANEAIRSDEVLAAFKTQGIDPIGSTPEEFATYVKSEIEKWGKVVRAAGIKR